MCDHLQTRSEIKGLSNPKEEIERLIEIKKKVIQLNNDCIYLVELLKTSEPLDTEIIFHFILGCIEILPIYIYDIETIIRKSGFTTFPVFTEYIKKKRERFIIQIKDIKKQEFIQRTIDGVEIKPVKIKDNVDFYKLWKRSREEPTKELKFEEIDSLLVQDKPEMVGNK
jgi:hypothetical protein